jgi:predicted Zn-dependent protease
MFAGNIDQAWRLFNDNKLKEAREQFTACKQNTAEKADACLGLSLICQMENRGAEAFQHFKEYCAVHKNPYPALLSLWSTESVTKSAGKLEKARLAFVEEISKKENIDGMMKAKAFDAIMSHYLNTNQFDKAREIGKNIGAVDKWALVGEFENISASGFDKDVGALAHPEMTYKFKNKFGAEVTWFRYERLRNDLWLDFEYIFNTDASIIYAQTFCNSPDERQVQLRLGTSGSYKLWLNDQLVSQAEEERNNDFDTYNSKVTLQKGVNRILIQIGSSELENSNLMLRVTDNNGYAYKDLIFQSLPDEYTKDQTGQRFEQVPIFAEKYFLTALSHNKHDFASQILLANMYLRNEKTFDARQLIKQIEKDFPNSLYLLYLKEMAFTQDKNYAGISEILKKMKEIDSNSLFALQLEYNEQYDKENYMMAEKIADKIDALFPQDESSYQRKISLASENKQIEKYQALIVEGYNKYPDNAYFVSLLYDVEKNANKNKKAANKLLEKYLQENVNLNYTKLLAFDLMENGKFEAGVNMYKNLVTNYPFGVGFMSTLANIYFEVKKYKEAESWIKTAGELAPYMSGIYSTLGKIYREDNRKSEAIDMFKKAIYYYPRDYTSREQINKLEGKRPIFDYFTAPNYTALSKNPVSEKDFPDDNAYVLHHEVQTVVYKGGVSEEKHFIMTKTLNKAGVDNWKEYEIDYYGNQNLKIEDAYIIKKNGSKVDAETNRNNVVYRNLEEGDAICLTYKLYNFYSGKLAENYWDKFVFTSTLPIKNAKYSLLVDKDLKFNWKVSNSAMQPEIKDVDGYKMYVWQTKDQKALKPEKFMPAFCDVGEVLYISTFPDWDYISKWYADLALTKTKPDYEVKEIIQELFPDKSKTTVNQKVHMIYDYIVKNIRYSSISFRQSGLIPQKPADVLNTKIGDCKDVSSLFVAMCKEVGIDANLVLVATRDNGDNPMPLPTIDFNHCIARVDLDGEPYYVELTTDLYPFSTFNTNLLKATALEINKNKQALIVLNPPSRKKNLRHRNTTIRFKDNKMVLERKVLKTGADGGSMRSTYRDIGQEARNKELKASLASEYSSVKLEHFAFDNSLYTTGDSLTYSYSYSVSSNAVFQEIAGMNVMKLIWGDEISRLDFINEEERKFPIEIYYTLDLDETVETVTLNLPAGKTLAQVPANVKLSNEFADYSVEFSLKGSVLTATRKMIPKKDIIPANQFALTKEFFEKVIKTDKTQLAIK